MISDAPRPTRAEFCEFLAALAAGNGSAEQWMTCVVEHYPDDLVEEERRNLVRAAIAAPGDWEWPHAPASLRAAAREALARLA